MALKPKPKAKAAPRRSAKADPKAKPTTRKAAAKPKPRAAATKPAPKARAEAAKPKPKARKSGGAPKFGSPEWRKKYLKPKAKPKA